jgi:hypothetical protein
LHSVAGTGRLSGLGEGGRCCGWVFKDLERE